MTMPNFGQPPQAGQRDGRGFVQMPGGYNEAVQQANGGGQQQQAQQQVPQFLTTLGQPAQVNMQGVPAPLVEQGWRPPPQFVQQPAQQQQQGQQVPFQQQQVQQQQPFPQQQQFQQPNQQQQQVDPLRQPLNDPRLPAHLQGRSVGELVMIAEGLRNVHLQSMQNGQQPIPQQQQQQVQQQPGQQQQQTGDWDWRKPRESVAATVREVLQSDLLPALAPMMQQNGMNMARNARDQAAAEIGPTFSQLEPLILNNLRGMDPRHLQDVNTWRVAARAVIGDLTLQAARQGGLPFQQQGQQGQQQQGGFPQQVVQQGQQPLPNLNTFFSEQPNQGGPAGQGINLTPMQEYARQQMGMTRDAYVAWGGGIQGGVR